MLPPNSRAWWLLRYSYRYKSANILHVTLEPFKLDHWMWITPCMSPCTLHSGEIYILTQIQPESLKDTLWILYKWNIVFCPHHNKPSHCCNSISWCIVVGILLHVAITKGCWQGVGSVDYFKNIKEKKFHVFSCCSSDHPEYQYSIISSLLP